MMYFLYLIHNINRWLFISLHFYYWFSCSKFSSVWKKQSFIWYLVIYLSLAHYINECNCKKKEVNLRERANKRCLFILWWISCFFALWLLISKIKELWFYCGSGQWFLVWETDNLKKVISEKYQPRRLS